MSDDLYEIMFATPVGRPGRMSRGPFRGQVTEYGIARVTHPDHGVFLVSGVAFTATPIAEEKRDPPPAKPVQQNYGKRR